MKMKTIKKLFKKKIHERLSNSASLKKFDDKLDRLDKAESKMFFLVTSFVFVSEFLIMLLFRILPPFSPWMEAIIDSSFLSILIFPTIYIFLFRPLKRNIVERKRNESSYRSLIENMGEGVGMCDLNEKFIFANAETEKIFGVEDGELLGVGLNTFFQKDKFDFIVNQTKERIKGNSGKYETEIVLKDGTKKNILVTATPQFDGEEFLGTLAIFRDISEIKKAENATIYERNLLRALIDNLPDAVYVKDNKCRKIIANPVEVKYMGFSKEEDVLGKDDYDIYPKEIADSSFNDDQIVFKTGLPQINKEDYFTDNQNKEHWMLNSKVPIKDATGNIIGLVGIGREITERKKEETRLKLLESVITHATDGVAITEINSHHPHQNKIVFINDAYTKITGYLKEDVIGKSPSILQGPNTDKQVLKRVSESITNYKPCVFEVINYKKNREEFWSSISISPITDNNGNYTHWIAIKRDITERKRMEIEFIKAKEKAEAGSKAKSEFLANMSHEIRTPLNSVIGFSDLLLKTKLDDSQHQYISAVYQSANSLLDIINQILDFSKIEAGKLEIEINKTDLLDLSYQVTDVISYQTYKKNLELLINIAVDIPRFIWTDALRLRQVLVNLLGNAVKFTTEGEIELKIETLKIETNGKSTFRFSVRDTGIGIDPANHHKIFEAFSQEDASTNRKFGGTGLGLAISKKLLVLLGSELQLQSIPKKGSTFFFDLTVQTLDGDAEVWTNNNNLKNILIVDDNFNNRHLLKDMLAIKKINTEEAENGVEALNKIEAGNKYDVVLMDYQMPEMDGLVTIKNIRQKLKISAEEMPIMLLYSSADDNKINAACKEFEVHQRLVKPIKINALFESLSKIGTQKINKTKQPVKKEDKTNQKYEYFKVLVVDDNMFNILLIKTMISDILPNAIIIEANDGKEAVECYKNEHPNIIFMDIQMPEMNGYEATIAIRQLETETKIPIIALTAGTLKEEKEKCLVAGMNDYVAKPFVSATIVGSVNKWLLSKPGNFVGDWNI